VKARFFDRRGKQVMTLSAATDNLAPGKTWDFFIMYHREIHGEKVDSVKIEQGASW